MTFCPLSLLARTDTPYEQPNQWHFGSTFNLCAASAISNLLCLQPTTTTCFVGIVSIMSQGAASMDIVSVRRAQSTALCDHPMWPRD